MRATILLAIFATLGAVAHITRPLHVTIYCEEARAYMILTTALEERINVRFVDGESEVEQSAGLKLDAKTREMLDRVIGESNIEDAIKLQFVDDGDVASSSDLIIAVNPKSRDWVKGLLAKKKPILLLNVKTNDPKLLSYLGASLPDKARKVTELQPAQEHAITHGMKPWKLSRPAVGLDPMAKSRELEAGGCIWTREIDGVRIVATTLGSDFPTLLDARVHDILGQSALWLTEKLSAHGAPMPGYGGNGETATLDVMRELLAISPRTTDSEDGPSEEVSVDLGDSIATEWKAIFDAPASGRYLTFEVFSTHSDGQFATISEFLVLGPDGSELSRKDWRVVSSSSEQAPKQKAKHILDGDPATIWHSRYINGIARFPHTLRIDMRSSQTVTGVICEPREGSKAGLIKGYRVYLSEEAGRGALATQGEFAK
ncbi:MAG: hypothetical protein ACI8W8_003670 [Rhodothermales bacterium]|jgi:hypothetical protein